MQRNARDKLPHLSGLYIIHPKWITLAIDADAQDCKALYLAAVHASGWADDCINASGDDMATRMSYC